MQILPFFFSPVWSSLALIHMTIHRYSISFLPDWHQASLPVLFTPSPVPSFTSKLACSTSNYSSHRLEIWSLSRRLGPASCYIYKTTQHQNLLQLVGRMPGRASMLLPCSVLLLLLILQVGSKEKPKQYVSHSVRQSAACDTSSALQYVQPRVTGIGF